MKCVDSSVCSRTLVFLFIARLTTDLYTLSLHDALPISGWAAIGSGPTIIASGSNRTSWVSGSISPRRFRDARSRRSKRRSEEHTSELQSRENLVCRLLLEKKKCSLESTPSLLPSISEYD